MSMPSNACTPRKALLSLRATSNRLAGAAAMLGVGAIEGRTVAASLVTRPTFRRRAENQPSTPCRA